MFHKKDGKVKVWLDCDPGNDDSMAIVMALFDPSCHLMGVSTVFGNNSIDKVTSNAIRLLSSLGRKDIPVYKGAAMSIAKRNVTASIHGDDGMYGANRMKPEFEPISDKSLYQLIQDQSQGQKFTMVMTGAHTNIALLFNEHPEIVDQINRVIFMGGSAGFGNITPNAEFNIYSDPEACQQVIDFCEAHQCELVMVSLDITHTVQVTEEVKNRIELINKPFAHWCSDMLHEFAVAYRNQEFQFPPLHDPVAMYYALYPNQFRVRQINVSVETQSKQTYGRTICDKFKVLHKKENVFFCDSVDLNNFWDCMLEAIKHASDVAQII